MSEDPTQFSSGDLNQFRYVFNNPGNLRDPYGENAVLAGIAIAVGVGVGLTCERPNSSQNDPETDRQRCQAQQERYDRLCSGNTFLQPDECKTQSRPVCN